MGRVSPDPNNAVIEGRVTLPSGFSADRNVKITLRNSQSFLSTLYSNKHGEFRFDNLSEGVYYVQAEIDGADFEPGVEKVVLGRGIVWALTLQLREKKSPLAMSTGARVISAAELHQPVPPAAKKRYDLGLKLVSKGDIAEAAAHFKEAISIYPDYLAARNDLGAQYLKLKRLDEAEEHFRIVLEHDAKNFNAKFNLGLVQIERRDYTDAISHLNQAIAIDNSRATARLWLGFALLETGELRGAERELTRALIMGGSECAAAHYHLARAYMARGEDSEALRSLQAYLQESPRGEYVKEARHLAEKLQAGAKRESKQ
jgi:Tfp pilus assembly protein PilF